MWMEPLQIGVVRPVLGRHGPASPAESARLQKTIRRGRFFEIVCPLQAHH